MNRKMLGLLASALLLATASAQDIELPKPETKGGMPLMEALAKRVSTRAFLPKELPPQVLSNLLWAADGLNRPDGKRTAPSAMNMQEIDLYLLTKSGVYLYDAQGNKLVQKSKEDIRNAGGVQPFVKTAPLILVYVANFSHMDKAKGMEMKRSLYNVDSGFISQNVYLFAASNGLATVVLGLVDRPELFKKMGFKEGEAEIAYTQPIGYPDVSKIPH